MAIRTPTAPRHQEQPRHPCGLHCCGCTGINADVQGVAPDAQIANMNVFNSSGSASYADILSALEDCMLLGVVWPT